MLMGSLALMHIKEKEAASRSSSSGSVAERCLPTSFLPAGENGDYFVNTIQRAKVGNAVNCFLPAIS